MLTASSFNNAINGFTLWFHNSDIEAYYRTNVDDTYMSRFSPFYLILACSFLVNAFAIYRVYEPLSKGMIRQGVDISITLGLAFLALLLEVVVNYYKRLRVSRTVFFSFLVFVGNAWGNASLFANTVPGIGLG